MRAVGSVEIVEAFPFVQFGFDIYVTFVAEKFIEFLDRLSDVNVRLFRSTEVCRV